MPSGADFTIAAVPVIPPAVGNVRYPLATKNYHHEIELVVAIGAPAFRVSVADASKAVYGYAAGLDMTRRDLQIASREKSRPWDFGKDFDEAAPCSALVPASKIGHPAKGAIWLEVNGAMKQNATLNEAMPLARFDVGDPLSRYPGGPARPADPLPLATRTPLGRLCREQVSPDDTRRTVQPAGPPHPSPHGSGASGRPRPPPADEGLRASIHRVTAAGAGQ